MAFVYQKGSSSLSRIQKFSDNDDFFDEQLFQEIFRYEHLRNKKVAKRKINYFKKFKKEQSPGPASYNIPSKFDSINQRPGMPPFLSSQKKLQHKQSTELPGPAQYFQNQPSRKKPEGSSKQNSFIALNSAKQLNKYQSIPSIPLKGSYGYSILQNSRLQPNKLTDGEETQQEVQNDKSPLQLQRSLLQNSVFASKSPRIAYLIDRSSSGTIGPGEYDLLKGEPQPMARDGRNPMPKARLLPLSITKYSESSSQEQPCEEYLPNSTPGPGSYQIKPKESSHGFYMVDQQSTIAMPDSSEVGPGSYDPQQQGKKRLIRHVKQAGEGFGCSAARFLVGKQQQLATPSPSQYQIPGSIKQNAFKKMSLGYIGSFMKKEPRFKDSEQSDGMQISLIDLPRQRSRRICGGVVGKQQRFIKQAASKVGPGSYELSKPDAPRGKGQSNVAFGSVFPKEHIYLVELDYPEKNQFYDYYSRELGQKEESQPSRNIFSDEKFELDLSVKPKWIKRSFNVNFQGHRH